jgi:3-hydroxymyristoyl/3-hydroxydecanoyl-(acyl carrier protein) dehydratase
MNSNFRSTVEQSLQHARQTGTIIEAEALFPSSAPIFQGHFPGKPIVPAVYQIALCRLAVEKHVAGTFMQVSRSRFSAACIPDVLYKVKISIEETAESVGATCSLWQEKVIHSKIVLLYGKPTTPG